MIRWQFELFSLCLSSFQSLVTSVDLSLSLLSIERVLTANDVARLVAKLFILRYVFIEPAVIRGTQKIITQHKRVKKQKKKKTKKKQSKTISC